MTKKKILKEKIGEIFITKKDIEEIMQGKGKAFSVFSTAWRNESGNYSKTYQIFVNEVEVGKKEEGEKTEKVEA